MADRLAGLDDAALEIALRDLGRAIATPAPGEGLDPARAARIRIEDGEAPLDRRRRWSWLHAPSVRPGRGPVRRGVVLALAAAVAVAAVAGAIGFGLPSIRVVPAPPGSATATGTAAGPGGSPPPTSSQSPSPSPSRSPTVGPLGSTLGLGDPMVPGDATTVVDIPVRLPTAAGVGSPATAWLREGRLSFVWPAGPSLPAMTEAGVGLVLSEFRGSLNPGYFKKILDQGTTIEPVTVDGVPGYWISGAPHEIVYVDADGDPAFDSRRSVGDTLLWARDDVTYRLESGLGRDRTVALADTLR